MRNLMDTFSRHPLKVKGTRKKIVEFASSVDPVVPAEAAQYLAAHLTNRHVL